MSDASEPIGKIDWKRSAKELEARLADLEAERALLVTRAENAEAALVEAEAKIAELLDALGCEMDDTRNACAAVNAEIDRVYKRLAAADALLRESVPFIGWGGRPDGLMDRIDAHLSHKERP